MTTPVANYICGTWRDGDPAEGMLTVMDPRTDRPIAELSEASEALVDEAVRAARAAFDGWARTPVIDRASVLRSTAALMRERSRSLAEAVSQEMGAPVDFAERVQIGLPILALETTADELERFEFEEEVRNSRVLREPVGVVAAVTPWNYPIYQVVAKLAPAIGAGCTVVVKPAEIAPLSVIRLFQILEDAGAPAGVVNLVNGRGHTVGEQLVRHPEVDVVSFTGSTETGTRIAAMAAMDVKRVTLELGGKSASVVFDDADVEGAVTHAVNSSMSNCGQTCSAITRLVVPRDLLREVEGRAKAAVDVYGFGVEGEGKTELGPLASRQQQQTVLGYIESGLAEGAHLITGGADVPDLGPGYYVQPTVFSDVRPNMRIAREEIFGPVLVIIPVDSDEEAIEVANGTDYGLSGAVWSADQNRAMAAACAMRTGQVSVNGGSFNPTAPFGGYKRSGYGRELGKFGLEEYLTYKAVQL